MLETVEDDGEAPADGQCWRYKVAFAHSEALQKPTWYREAQRLTEGVKDSCGVNLLERVDQVAE